jgi:hypothetical protein
VPLRHPSGVFLASCTYNVCISGILKFQFGEYWCGFISFFSAWSSLNLTIWISHWCRNFTIIILKYYLWARHGRVMPVIPALRRLRQEIWVWHQPGLHSETLSQNNRKRKKEFHLFFPLFFIPVRLMFNFIALSSYLLMFSIAMSFHPIFWIIYSHLSLSILFV